MKKRVLDVLQAGLMYGLIGLFRCYDVDRASALGARLSKAIMGKRLARPKTIETIRIAFPDIDRAGLDRMMDGMAESLGRALGEIAHLRAFMGEEGRKRFRFEGLENLEAAQARGRPLIIVSGHFGNFELEFAGMHHLGVETSVMTQRQSNRFVDSWATNNRAQTGLDQQYTNEHAGMRRMYYRLRAGRNVGMLIDQAAEDGAPVQLFNRPAMTTLTPATLALKLDATILPVAVRRDEGAHFTVVIHAPILPPYSESPARDIMAMTRMINSFVEQEVLARPTDWLWMHPRWTPPRQLSRRARNLIVEAGLQPPNFSTGHSTARNG